MNAWESIVREIESATGIAVNATSRDAVGGGSINQAYRIAGTDRQFFVKLNAARLYDMFAAEAEGLEEIAGSHTVRVPLPVCLGSEGDTAWLVLEYLELDGRGGEARLGHQLAAMHRTESDRFGWHRDNTIGATPQVNTWSDNWIGFWQENRLGYQLNLAAGKGRGGQLRKLGDRLLAALPDFFTGYTPQPSLLHGDLWSGNYGTLSTGEPVIFDPAVYFGDREADLAMTELFGGFGSNFYAAYHEAYPLDEGYRTRRTLYNLYHILNHLNLFGSGYHRQAVSMTEQLLGEVC